MTLCANRSDRARLGRNGQRLIPRLVVGSVGAGRKEPKNGRMVPRISVQEIGVNDESRPLDLVMPADGALIGCRLLGFTSIRPSFDLWRPLTVLEGGRLILFTPLCRCLITRPRLPEKICPDHQTNCLYYFKKTYEVFAWSQDTKKPEIEGGRPSLISAIKEVYEKTL